MYLDIRKGKDRRFYIMQGFRVKGGGTSTKVYMKLGKESDIKEKYGCADAEACSPPETKGDKRQYKGGQGLCDCLVQS